MHYLSSKRIEELDFLLEDASGQIAALEMKFGVSYRIHAALDRALAESKYTIDRAFVLAETGWEGAPKHRNPRSGDLSADILRGTTGFMRYHPEIPASPSWIRGFQSCFNPKQQKIGERF